MKSNEILFFSARRAISSDNEPMIQIQLPKLRLSFLGKTTPMMRVRIRATLRLLRKVGARQEQLLVQKKRNIANEKASEQRSELKLLVGERAVPNGDELMASR
jgi:hypothetical protein